MRKKGTTDNNCLFPSSSLSSGCLPVPSLSLCDLFPRASEQIKKRGQKRTNTTRTQSFLISSFFVLCFICPLKLQILKFVSLLSSSSSSTWAHEGKRDTKWKEAFPFDLHISCLEALSLDSMGKQEHPFKLFWGHLRTDSINHFYDWWWFMIHFTFQ